MIADAGLDAGRFRAPPDNAVGVLLEEGPKVGEREIPGGQIRESTCGLGKLLACLNLPYRLLRFINFA